ncbi:hypothetical protein [Streptomyces sp. S1]|uniref:hypothetical protein n=1 Tax=Streptomyces sp. S1 TaxID=718288 RepID=UPI003D70C192
MRVLFCGGPVDGQWRDVDITWELLADRQQRSVEVVAPPTPLEFAHGTGTLTKTLYRVWQVSLLGHRLVVAAPYSDHNESDSVLYAVLRRDVADHLRGKS